MVPKLQAFKGSVVLDRQLQAFQWVNPLTFRKTGQWYNVYCTCTLFLIISYCIEYLYLKISTKMQGGSSVN